MAHTLYFHAFKFGAKMISCKITTQTHTQTQHTTHRKRLVYVCSLCLALRIMMVFGYLYFFALVKALQKLFH